MARRRLTLEPDRPPQFAVGLLAAKIPIETGRQGRALKGVEGPASLDAMRRAPPAAVEILDGPFQLEKGSIQEIDGEWRRLVQFEPAARRRQPRPVSRLRSL